MKDSSVELASRTGDVIEREEGRGREEEEGEMIGEGVGSVHALLYKSIIIQKRNYCSNICQLITPLVCIAFTLLAQLISNEIISDKIQSFNFPQPLDFPYFYTLVDRLGLSCEQGFLYEVDGNADDKIKVEMLLNKTLKYYCDKSDKLMPEFTFTESVNEQLMSRIKQADV